MYMATVALIEYEDASPEVRAVYDDIREVRQTDFINNFWKGLANNPAQLRRTWEQTMPASTASIRIPPPRAPRA
jgi:hypothetical protein